jgi:hypothetical protein
VGVGVGVALLGATIYAHEHSSSGQLVYSGRNFFGTHSVSRSQKFMSLWHGNTLHGEEAVGTDGKPVSRPVALSYYHPDGPLGPVFRALHERDGEKIVGVIGLGSGAIAAYGRPGDEFIFYEIDPAIERLARDRRYFTYLGSSRANCHVVLGDGRLSVDRERAGRFDLLIVDAFNSDSIPVHLLTREALRMYMNKLAPGGMLLLHLSNRYLGLPLIIGVQAEEAGLPYAIREDSPKDKAEHDAERERGKESCVWALLARSHSELAAVVAISDRPWVVMTKDPRLRPWTDDFSSIFSIMNWRNVFSSSRPDAAHSEKN